MFKNPPFFLLLGLFLLCATGLFAHPPWGMVVKDDGTVYFADVFHGNDGTLWKYSPDGSLISLLEEFHCHTLVGDQEGNLWAGVHIWREGEIEGDGINLLLKIRENEGKVKVDTVLNTRHYSEFAASIFALRPDGKNLYFSGGNTVMLQEIDAQTTMLGTISRSFFPRINSLYCDPADNLWITDSELDNGTLFRWNPESGLTTIAKNLFPIDRKDAIFEETNHHLFSGINTDPAFPGKVFLADNVTRSIRIIDIKSGKDSVFYHSTSPWYPLNIDFANGVPYIMEAAYDHQHYGPGIIRKNLEKNEWELVVWVNQMLKENPEIEPPAPISQEIQEEFQEAENNLETAHAETPEESSDWSFILRFVGMMAAGALGYYVFRKVLRK